MKLNGILSLKIKEVKISKSVHWSNKILIAHKNFITRFLLIEIQEIKY